MAPLNPLAPVYVPVAQFSLQLRPSPRLPPLIFDQTLIRSPISYYNQAPFPQIWFYVYPFTYYSDTGIKHQPLVQGCSFDSAAPCFYPPTCSIVSDQEAIPSPLVSEEPSLEGEGEEVEVRRVHHLRDYGRCSKRNRFGGLRCGPRRRWRPAVHKNWLCRIALLEEYQKKDVNGCRVEGEKTTMMIKNLPNKLSKKQLLSLLDQHCRDENKELPSGTNEIISEFNFFYLPIDFVTRNNLGYAFVNFTSSIAATRFYRFFNGRDWVSFGSRKICEVTYARFQGLASLMEHFSDKEFSCDDKEYLPVRFCPNRNGFRATVEKYVSKLRSEEQTTG